MKRILFVDSDGSVLNALQQLFWDGRYQVHTAENGAAALEIMNRMPISLVVSEMLMPQMDGRHLLQTIKAKFPSVIRVILSSCVDEKVVARSLIDNLAKIYLYKPWDNKMLRDMIDNLFETETVLQGNELLAIIRSTEELPTIKMSFRNILQLLDGDPSVEEVTREIEKDQAIAGRLLRLVNSAFYGVKTGSISQAIKYLGYNTIHNLVLSTPIMDSLSLDGPDGELVEKQWQHAFMTNSILIQLYERHLRRRLSEVEGTAGLLHNIGIAFLIKQYRQPYIHLLQQREVEEQDLVALEKLLLNTAHPEVGGFLLRWWELPYPIIEAALYHHNPGDHHIINKELVMAVHIAQHYAFLQMNEPFQGHLLPDAFEYLGIDRNRFDQEMKNQRVLF